MLDDPYPFIPDDPFMDCLPLLDDLFIDRLLLLDDPYADCLLYCYKTIHFWAAFLAAYCTITGHCITSLVSKLDVSLLDSYPLELDFLA